MKTMSVMLGSGVAALSPVLVWSTVVLWTTVALVLAWVVAIVGRQAPPQVRTYRARRSWADGVPVQLCTACAR